MNQGLDGGYRAVKNLGCLCLREVLVVAQEKDGSLSDRKEKKRPPHLVSLCDVRVLTAVVVIQLVKSGSLDLEPSGPASAQVHNRSIQVGARKLGVA